MVRWICMRLNHTWGPCGIIKSWLHGSQAGDEDCFRTSCRITLAPEHPWAAKLPLPDWFHGTVKNHLNSSAPVNGTFYGEPENQGHDLFEALVDPHAPSRLWRNLTEGWFVDLLPDMNTENPVVAQYLLQNAIWWTESSGLDGFRVDTFPYVSREFWARWHAGLRRIYPRLTTIGEVFHPDASVTSFFVGGQKQYDGTVRA